MSTSKHVAAGISTAAISTDDRAAFIEAIGDFAKRKCFAEEYGGARGGVIDLVLLFGGSERGCQQ